LVQEQSEAHLQEPAVAQAQELEVVPQLQSAILVDGRFWELAKVWVGLIDCVKVI
jgi:hypothetical protein